MPLKVITESSTECHDLHGQAIVYCLLNGEPHVIAKSIVKLLSDSDYLCGENPYIHLIIEKLPNDTILLPVVGEELLSKIWDNPGDKKDVYFVKAKALIEHLEEIFPNANKNLLHSVQKAMQGYIQSVQLKQDM